MDILVDKERMNSIIEFWQKKCAAAEAETAELKAENERLKQQLAEIGKSWDEIQRLKRENEQKIRKIAEVGQDKYHNGLILAKPIIDLITKAEEE